MNNLNEGNQKNYLYFEIFVVVLGSIALFLVFANFALGGPNSTDVTWYMNVGLNGIKDTFIINRYFHVFLEALFLKLSPTPLIGLQYYWAFLIAGSSLVVYLASRLLTSRTNLLHGLLAVALFISVGAITDTAGLPLVDITAMFMVLLIVVLYVISARKEHVSKVLIIVIGLLFLFSLKTKETTLPVAILFLGFGYVEDKRFDLKVLFKRLGLVLIGVVFGIGLFILLNMIFLGDSLFGFRLVEIQKFLETYVSGSQSSEKYSGYANWFTAFFLNDMWIIFLAYLISGTKAAFNPFIKKGNLLVWLIPIAIILFATFSVGNQWGFQSRFIYPAIPIICLLGPQFLNLDLRNIHENHKRFIAISIFIIGLLAYFVLRISIRYIFDFAGWDITIFMAAVITPLLVSAILALVFLWKRIPLYASYLIAVLIIAIVSVPITHNLKQIFINQPNKIASERFFYPFASYENLIEYTPIMKFYISPDVWREMETSNFLKDRIEVSSLFNVFFDAGSTKHNFIVPEESSDIPGDLINSDFTHVLLSASDWQAISALPEISGQLENKYFIYSDDKNVLVFLKPKP